ncbi:MAG: hypothetical protein IE933_14995 [Sphingomonadales bacterium]|nr:hypothetical protein [Sphingomonadales bacterium]MBD3773517.1 hypothetical protein [Paracoccaceae bacterium]
MEWSEKNTTEVIELLFQELVDFAKRASADFKSIRDDRALWYELPHPSGSGSLLTSKVASAAVDELVARALRLRNLEARVSHGDLKKELGQGLVQRFLSEKRPIDKREADRLLSWAAKRAEGRCGEFTYFYPVRFTFQEEPGEIDLGPVRLAWLRKFHSSLFAYGRAYLRECTDEKSLKWARDQLRDALEYYKSYKWFAAATVKGCDEKRAEEAAHDLLTSALDCLYFLIGRKGTYRVEIGRFKLANDVRALAWIKPNGSMTVQTSRGSLDAMGFRDGWSEDLSRADVLETLDLIRTVLEAKADLRLRRPLASRFLDAARWFGEAVRDRQSFSKIVKFITAIERLVIAGKIEDISETVATRVADLTLESDDRGDWEKKRAIVKKAYGLRSNLVHGSVSPFADDVLRGVSAAGDLSEEVLYTVLHRIRKDGLVAPDVSEREYAQWYDGIRNWVQEIHARTAEGG